MSTKSLLSKPLSFKTSLIFAVIGAGVLTILFVVTDAFALTNTIIERSLNTGEQIRLALLFLGAYFGGAVYLAWRKPTFENPKLYMIALLLLIAGVFIRVSVLDLPFFIWGDYPNQIIFQFSQDYTVYLGDWVAQMRPLSIRDALVTEIGDYNMPYLYLLTIISRLSMPDVYLIKWVSSVFDIAIAIAVMEVVRHFAKKQSAWLAAIGVTLFYPITWLNSAYWAQCDVIFTFFVVLALLFALKNRPLLSVAMAALGFSFKLQAVFFLPIYPLIAVLCIYAHHKKRSAVNRKLTVLSTAFPLILKAAGVFVGVLFATLLPALLAGRSLSSTLDIYINQANARTAFLSLNASNFMAYFVPGVQIFEGPGWVRQVLIAVAFIFIGVMLTIGIWRWDKDKDNLAERHRDLLTLSLLLPLGIVWLLPQMHDRYFYMADIFAITYVVVNPHRNRVLSWAALCFVFIGSFAGYSHYFGFWWQDRFQVPLPLGATGILLAIVLVLFLWLHKGDCCRNNKKPVQKNRPA